MLSGHPSVAVAPDSIVPLDHVLNVEVAEASSILTRKEAKPIVLKLLERYEDQLKNPPKGLAYQDCYDVIKGQLKNVDKITKVIQEIVLQVAKNT